MMFHVEQNKKIFIAKVKTICNRRKVQDFLDQNNIIGKTFPVPQKDNP